MRSAVRPVLAVAAAVALVVGCGLVDDERAVGTRVARWTEATSGQGWTSEVVRDDPVLVTTPAERNTWVDGLPQDADTDAVAAELADVDLAEHVLVIGSFSRCTEDSRVLVGSDDGAPVVRFEVTDPEPEVDCAWSPATVDAWAVPLSDTDGVVPRLVVDD